MRSTTGTTYLFRPPKYEANPKDLPNTLIHVPRQLVKCHFVSTDIWTWFLALGEREYIATCHVGACSRWEIRAHHTDRRSSELKGPAVERSGSAGQSRDEQMGRGIWYRGKGESCLSRILPDADAGRNSWERRPEQPGWILFDVQFT